MKSTLNEQEFAFFANHKKDIMDAFIYAELLCFDRGYKGAMRKYSSLWKELFSINSPF